MYISEISKGKPATATGSVAQAFELLDELSIAYEYVSNDVVESMEESSVVSQKLGAEIRKTIFVTNQNHSAFYLIVLPADKRFDSKKFRDNLGISRVSFASPELMEEKIGVRPGTASIFSLLLDAKKEVKLVIDKSIKNDEYFACNPTDNTYHIKFKTEDLLSKLLPKLGYRAWMLDL